MELEHALKAYAQTEKNLKEANPDLFFNRGTIFEYLERYNEAVCDFETAHKIDPNLGADKKSEPTNDIAAALPIGWEITED